MEIYERLEALYDRTGMVMFNCQPYRGPLPGHTPHRSCFRHIASSTPMSTPLRGHPKLTKLESIVAEHFETHGETRVMIFAQYRETVNEIVETLSRNPSIKPEAVVGQQGSGRKKGLTQKPVQV